jgi:hypothetical protein
MDLIFKDAGFIGIYENLAAYYDSILTRFLSAIVGNFLPPQVVSPYGLSGENRQPSEQPAFP